MCDSTNCLVPGPARPRHRPQWSLRCFAATLGGLIFLSTSAASIALTQAAAPSLGRVHFPISCTARSQHEFERAVALLHHMTYPEARYAFRAIADAEPRCAMAYWGVAMTLFQPLWPTRPDLRALQEGWEATQKAKSLEPPTPRERAFVAAAEAFFIEPGSPDYWLRIRRWEQAQERVYAAYPDDPEAAVFYALAHLATAPSDVVSRDHADRAAAILLKVYAQNPDHPGAMHYLVHANDTPGRERENLDITRKYAALAPRNPHALHMPTHIFTRLGDWSAVVQGNLRAAEAALEQPAGDQKQFVWDEFPHAIEYLVYAYLQQGLDDEARAQVTRLNATARLEPTFKTAFHLASTRARLALERHDWREAASIDPRSPVSIAWDHYAWPEAIGHFARGVGSAQLGDLQTARAAQARLQQLEAAARTAGEEIFARNIRMLTLELAAQVLFATGDADSGVAAMREAADLEAATPKPPVTPASTLPAHEQLGDLLLSMQRPALALTAYQRSLDLFPNRYNSVLGAARAARALGRVETAQDYYRELLGIAGTGSKRPSLDEARAFTASTP